jgi:hypothetical protein
MRIEFGKPKTSFRVVSHLLGGNPNMFSVESFDTPEEARAHWEINYRDRNKGDGYDACWNEIPLVIMRTMTMTDLMFEEE